MSNIGQVKVDRGHGKEAVDTAVELLNKGLCVCIFPEGTRSRTGEMQRAHTGVVVIASRLNVPIVPILVKGTFQMMPPKNSFPRLFKRVSIRYGEQFYLTEEEKDLESKEKMRQVAESIMQRIKSLDDA